MSPVLSTGLFILGLSLFLDLLELSFSRVLWFIRTLRFWLYYGLHVGISCLAAYMLHAKLADWYLLAPVATLLGVSVISNTNVKIAGTSLVPVADLFQSIRAKMFEQAASEKLEQATRALLASRLRRLPLTDLEQIYRDIMAASGKVSVGEELLERERTKARGNQEINKATLIGQILRANVQYVEQRIDSWDPPPGKLQPVESSSGPGPKIEPPVSSTPPRLPPGPPPAAGSA